MAKVCEKHTTNSNDHIHNGLITKIWGEPGWIFNHSITFGYPINPTNEQKEAYRNYFQSLGGVLPCRYCRESYLKFISTGETALTDQVLENRETLTRWLFRVHNAVNNKLEMKYPVTYEDIVERYESFRAKCGKPSLTEKGCVAPLDYKAFSFKKLYYSEAPIIPFDSIEPFVSLVKIRNLDQRFLSFVELVKALDGDLDEIKKQSAWEIRNRYCRKQIRNMRENSIPSVETTGPWKGTPTPDELQLMLLFCSNLNKTEFDKVHSASVELLESIDKN